MSSTLYIFYSCWGMYHKRRTQNLSYLINYAIILLVYYAEGVFMGNSKKSIILAIYEILKEYSSENHPLSQSEIAALLEAEYKIKVDRKAIKRNLMELVNFGYNIEYKIIKRQNNGKEEDIYTDWYLVKDFTDAEVKLLIDSIQFSKHIPYHQLEELVEKVSKLASYNFYDKYSHVASLKHNSIANPQLFYTIEVLNRAIDSEKKVSFVYNEYGTDKKLHPRKSEEGKLREYIINPYLIVSAYGRYYLICNNDKYSNVSNYRIDKITDIKILDLPCKPMEEVSGLENGLDLPRHMAEHVYMFSGESVCVTFEAQKNIAGEIVDWFGKDVIFSNENDNTILSTVFVNKNAFLYWALQYGKHIKVIEPKSLAEDIKNAAFEIYQKYE